MEAVDEFLYMLVVWPCCCCDCVLCMRGSELGVVFVCSVCVRRGGVVRVVELASDPQATPTTPVGDDTPAAPPT